MTNDALDSASSTESGGRTAPPSRIGTIYFERGSAIPRSEDIAVLRRHARHLLLNPHSRLTIRGYSNRRRQNDGARQLARSRAAIIRMLLLTMGVKERQIDTEVGDIYRVTAATTRKSRAKNRRAELSAHSWDVGVSIMPSILQTRRRNPRLHQRAA
jgi:outer membrane protein OmpA-like peptidoglycan-associated protein